MDTNNQALKAILSGICNDLKKLQVSKKKGRYPNERYLHHYFSHAVQTKGLYCLNHEDPFSGTFHPEWATGGKYRKENGVYKCGEKGKDRSGNMDFALGNYCHPEYGIEFKYDSGWDDKALRFDYVKLLDKDNNIDKAISFAVIFRKTELSASELREAIDRLETELGSRLAVGRQFLFVIVQVAPGAKTSNIRSWYCNNLADGFRLMTSLEKVWFETK